MENKKNFFLSTRKPTGPYKFLVESSKIHSEKLLNQKLFLRDHNESTYDFGALLYLVWIIFKTNFFALFELLFNTSIMLSTVTASWSGCQQS